MTHQSNYANDRLAIYTFKRLFEFVRRYTNLQLRFAPSDDPKLEPQLGPLRLARLYFSMHSNEHTEPLWTVSIEQVNTLSYSSIYYPIISYLT